MERGNIYRYSTISNSSIYDTLASIYDKVMSHVDYELWTELIRKIIINNISAGKGAILELGGGTGNLGKLLIEKGYCYYGSDISFAMCKEANKKGIPFSCVDSRKLPFKKKFSLVIFLYDGVNYLMNLEEYVYMFEEIYFCLDRKGLFLFDITTRKNSLTNFADVIEAEDFGSSTYIRHSYYDTNESIQYNHFTIFRKNSEKNSLYKKEYKIHAQKIFSVKKILSSIPGNLFSVKGIWDNFSFKKYNRNSKRIHFLLERK